MMIRVPIVTRYLMRTGHGPASPGYTVDIAEVRDWDDGSGGDTTDPKSIQAKMNWVRRLPIEQVIEESTLIATHIIAVNGLDIVQITERGKVLRKQVDPDDEAEVLGP